MEKNVEIRRKNCYLSVRNNLLIPEKEIKRIGGINMKNNEVPLWLRYALTLSEASQYFNIGERKLQQIADENRDTGFVIYNGVKLLFKREKFAEWLNEVNAI